MAVILKNQTSDELYSRLSAIGLTPRQARQVQAAALKTGFIPRQLPDIPMRLMEKLAREVMLPHLNLTGKVTSPADGFTKYVFSGAGAGLFEAVRIPLMAGEKYVVCVSSQVGCGQGCIFCRTGAMGYKRDLLTWEIVDQVVKIAADSDKRITGVVFMGMGEPFMNYERVLQAARIMCEPCGLAVSAKAITISTAGIIPGILRLADSGFPFRLIVSLTAADPAVRLKLMPVEKKYPLHELVQAIRAYCEKTKNRVTIAWTMLRGVNVHEKDARDLAALLAGLPVNINLIDVNDPVGRYLPPTDQERAAFRDYLRMHTGMPVKRRYSGGKDIHAACGMLAESL
ncbi:MAG: radical SAM protein [Spirochaetales bacterium]|nr:radical SAM protein [Spirochaetales bacterium]